MPDQSLTDQPTGIEPGQSEERLSPRDPGRIGGGGSTLDTPTAEGVLAEAAAKAQYTGKLEPGEGVPAHGRKCPKGFIWNDKRGKCVKRDEPGGGGGGGEGRRCPPGFHWNSNTKECVKNQGDGGGKECPPGYHLNKDGKCVKNQGNQTQDEEAAPLGGPPVIPPIGGGGGGGGGGTSPPPSGGGGDSGGGTAAPAPKADPNQPLIDAGIRMYFSLWGQVPPSGYIEKLVKGGMNLFEIELNERSKPAFKKTKVYRDEAAQRINFLLQQQIVGYS